VNHFWLRAACAATLACASFAADTPVVPVTVCEIMRDLVGNEGKDVAVLGRYSFRSSGTWVAEQACQPTIPGPATLPLVEDKDAPKLPENYTLDAVALHRKLVDVQHRTSLGKFRFGTQDYDRWAVIYGRVEKRSGAPALMFRGTGVMVILTGQE
jgi:hypothetical protein